MYSSARNSARAPQTQRKPATTSSTHKSATSSSSHPSTSKPAAQASAPHPAPQTPHQSTPAPQPQYSQPYQRSGFLGTMAEGFAFGAGSAVAHNAVNGVVNAVTGRNKDNNAPVPVEETQETQEAAQRMENEDPCMLQRMDFNNCLQVNADKGISECQIFFDSFKRCQERVKMENMNRFE
ncbi:hypothetical protein BLSTO_01290 [Blastocystis sp. subtype 1]